jgi:defect in organelle trafficking protein DotC
MPSSPLRSVILALSLALATFPVTATQPMTPPTLNAYQSPPSKARGTEDTDLAGRGKHVKDAAFSYGLRAGLARRTWELQQDINRNAATLSAQYDFDRLLLPGKTGVPVLPPVVMISRGEGAKFEDNGRRAALYDEHIIIVKEEQLVSRPPSWRQYLDRDDSDVPPPDATLYPDADERDSWLATFNDGWKAGTIQAEDIFRENFAELKTDYIGMLLAHDLINQRKMTSPFVNVTDRGVTGDGHEMRIGDREVEITGPALLQHDPARWTTPTAQSTPFSKSENQR